MRSVLAQDIFRQDLTEVYRRQTQWREDLVQENQTVLWDAIQRMREEPAESLRQKAERGDAKAQYLLAKQLLTKAQGPEQITEAIRFLTASATQGNQYTQYALGGLYLSRKQIPKDRKPAIHWITLAAEQGNERLWPVGCCGCSGRWPVSFRTGSRRPDLMYGLWTVSYDGSSGRKKPP